jgi:uncharacterized Zn-binding protein involved in type VI secretion
MRPIATYGGSIRACGAVPFQGPNTDVFANLTPVVVTGSLDSHGGLAIIGSQLVVVNGIPCCGVGDVNDVCRWVNPPHYSQPIVVGEYNVSIT